MLIQPLSDFRQLRHAVIFAAFCKQRLNLRAVRRFQSLVCLIARKLKIIRDLRLHFQLLLRLLVFCHM